MEKITVMTFLLLFLLALGLCLKLTSQNRENGIIHLLKANYRLIIGYYIKQNLKMTKRGYINPSSKLRKPDRKGVNVDSVTFNIFVS